MDELREQMEELEKKMSDCGGVLQSVYILHTHP